MKANEFVKKHGWEAVISAVKGTNAEETAAFESKDLDPILAKNGSVIGFNVKIHAISYLDVKRLVESHDLVVQCGGLEDARSHLESIRFNIATKTWFGQALLNWSMYADKLVKAIADVESLKEVS